MQACKDAVTENKLEAAYLRPLAFLGDVGMGLRPPADAKADLNGSRFRLGSLPGRRCHRKRR